MMTAVNTLSSMGPNTDEMRPSLKARRGGRRLTNFFFRSMSRMSFSRFSWLMIKPSAPARGCGPRSASNTPLASAIIVVLHS